MQKIQRTRKPTSSAQRRYYAEYHYDPDDQTDPTTPWADVIGEYSTDRHTSDHRANGDDE